MDSYIVPRPLTADRSDGLSADEGRVMDALNDAVNAYRQLPCQHPDEPRDFVDAIHRCQDALAIRIARRHYPHGWPTHETHAATFEARVSPTG